MSERVLAGGASPRQLARVLMRLLLLSLGALLWLLVAETAAQAQEAPRGPEAAAANSQALEAKPPVAQSPQPSQSQPPQSQGPEQTPPAQTPPAQTPPAQTPPAATAPVGPTSSESPGQGVGRPESPGASGSAPGRDADVLAEIVAEPVVDAVEAIASPPGQAPRAVQRPGREPKRTAESSTPAPVATTPAKAVTPAERAPRRPAADPEPRLASLPSVATPPGSGLAPVAEAGLHERRTASLVPEPTAVQDAQRHAPPVPAPFEHDERLADLMVGGDAASGNGAPSSSGGSMIAFATLGSSQLLPACAVCTWDSAVRQHALPTGPSYPPGSSPG